MKRLFGRVTPVVVLSLLGLWLLLNQSLSPAHIVLGVVLALMLAWTTSSLRPLKARVRHLGTAALLILVVFRDIVHDNFSVASIVLGLRPLRDIRSGFLRIPLDLRDPHGLAALAAIVTATPGTVWAGLSSEGHTLTLHVLDLKDEAGSIKRIKDRYEKPLMRIFE